MGGEHSTKELAPGTWHGQSRDPIWPYSLVPWRPWAGSGMAGGLCCSGHACGACPRPASCRRGSICRGPALRPEGLCSLTQVTFSPSLPLFCPLLNSAKAGCVVRREGVPPPSQGSLNSLRPPCTLCPLRTPPRPGRAGLCLPAGRLPGAGAGVLCPSPGRPPAEGAHFPVCTHVPCGLVAPLAQPCRQEGPQAGLHPPAMLPALWGRPCCVLRQG